MSEIRLQIYLETGAYLGFFPDTYSPTTGEYTEQKVVGFYRRPWISSEQLDATQAIPVYKDGWS